MSLQHPMITQIMRTGYPGNMQQEHAGVDYYGTEIHSGDSIVELPNGEVLLEENLDDYLIEVLGFEFTTAK